MLPTTHKGCFLGAGDTLLGGRQLSWNPVFLYLICMEAVWVFLGVQTREIVQVAEAVTLVNSHSWAFWLCLFLLDVILNKREGTRQATDAGF